MYLSPDPGLRPGLGAVVAGLLNDGSPLNLQIWVEQNQPTGRWQRVKYSCAFCRGSYIRELLIGWRSAQEFLLMHCGRRMILIHPRPKHRALLQREPGPADRFTSFTFKKLKKKVTSPLNFSDYLQHFKVLSGTWKRTDGRFTTFKCSTDIRNEVKDRNDILSTSFYQHL